jgi:hypothetical protein
MSMTPKMMVLLLVAGAAFLSPRFAGFCFQHERGKCSGYSWWFAISHNQSIFPLNLFLG